jgi:hypothetical protein
VFLKEVWSRECFIEVYGDNRCKIIIVNVYHSQKPVALVIYPTTFPVEPSNMLLALVICAGHLPSDLVICPIIIFATASPIGLVT